MCHFRILLLRRSHQFFKYSDASMGSSLRWFLSGVINFFVLLNTRSHSADIAGIANISKAQRCSVGKVDWASSGRPWVTEARIEGSTFKNSLDESESSISKSEMEEWRNKQIGRKGGWPRQPLWLPLHCNWLRRKPRGPVARASRACSAGLASKACLPGPWAEGPRPGTVAH
jgi:hypothetical protein